MPGRCRAGHANCRAGHANGRARQRKRRRTPLGMSRMPLGMSRTPLGVSRRNRWVTPADGAATRVHHWVGSGPILARRGPPDGLRRFETGTASSSLRQAQDGPPTRAAGKTRRGEPSSEVALRSPRAPEVRAKTKVAPQSSVCTNLILQKVARFLRERELGCTKNQPVGTSKGGLGLAQRARQRECPAHSLWRLASKPRERAAPKGGGDSKTVECAVRGESEREAGWMGA
jgi:hypothetical protein